MGEDYEGGGSSFDTAGLIESLASNATQAYETTQALNANPLNTALVYGGTAQTAGGNAYGASPMAMPSAGGSGLLLLLLAAGVVIYAATR
jgi:hypothetical protein